MIKIKSCPEGKVINPKTGRCIKKENLEKQTKKTNIRCTKRAFK